MTEHSIRSQGHPCALHNVGLCDIRVGRNLLMCRDHWMLVPSPLRARINRYWIVAKRDVFKLPEEYFVDVELAIQEVQKKVETHGVPE